MEPKLLPHPYDTDAPFEYNIRRQPVLETTYTFPLHVELDVGGPIDILDPESYAKPVTCGPLDPLDELITDPKLAVSSAKKKAWGAAAFVGACGNWL